MHQNVLLYLLLYGPLSLAVASILLAFLQRRPASPYLRLFTVGTGLIMVGLGIYLWFNPPALGGTPETGGITETSYFLFLTLPGFVIYLAGTRAKSLNRKQPRRM